MFKPDSIASLWHLSIAGSNTLHIHVSSAKHLQTPISSPLTAQVIDTFMTSHPRRGSRYKLSSHARASSSTFRSAIPGLQRSAFQACRQALQPLPCVLTAPERCLDMHKVTTNHGVGWVQHPTQVEKSIKAAYYIP
ncbi:hypothetical protein BU25DRAFT_414622 [Macroventuria anomochaeta]|uniref:Uncharacterized protein n=1 Tax=Macroventuria anomochaeta TaxID=301207 RepID=A0ACB6RMK4_9PLEO|nr:uncharacterized protein BU25DRAFT_414622 [Macroventuria anomochaeta]KAF2623101.1 hypothetical protein BU25DRAFT_414622 [Macroventuria anomochaeta]